MDSRNCRFYVWQWRFEQKLPGTTPLSSAINQDYRNGSARNAVMFGVQMEAKRMPTPKSNGTRNTPPDVAAHDQWYEVVRQENPNYESADNPFFNRDESNRCDPRDPRAYVATE